MYHITVGDEKDQTIVSAQGSFGLVNYAGKEAIAALSSKSEAGDVSVVFSQQTRIITNLTADAGTVALVLKAKLAEERKRQTATA